MGKPPFDWEGELQFAALTDVGMRRSNNQDSHGVQLAPDLASWLTRGHLFMVADGMGAHAAGELASKMAVDNVAHRYQKFAEGLDSPPEALQKSIVETNAAIHARGLANSDFRNMGTTGSVLVLLPQGALVAQIGDSRIYRLRGQRIEQLTRDHSLVWELRELGRMGDGKEPLNVPKNVITRSLGPYATVEADIEGPLPIEVGDVFLLCSDGLTGKLEDSELATMLAYLPPHEAAQMFIHLANLRGGPDNITAIVVRVVGNRLATDHERVEPIKMGAGGAAARRQEPREVLIWVLAAVAGLAVFVLWLTNNPIPAAVAAIGGTLLSVYNLIARRLTMRQAVELGNGRRLGRGPYTQTACPHEDEAWTTLSKLCRELQRMVEQRGLAVDWRRFETHIKEAEAAETSKNLRAAMLAYAHGIQYLMQLVRDEQRKRLDNTMIEL
jgi:serine/threonine protein phosphatase PrpC